MNLNFSKRKWWYKHTVDGSGISAKALDHYQFDFTKVWVDPGPSVAGNPGPFLKVQSDYLDTRHRVYPRLQVGDTLWVREKWKLPKEASRIHLEVTNVRAERLDDITEQDAIDEGVEKWPDGNYKAYGKHSGKYTFARDSFCSLWNSINGECDKNTWVWVYSFKRIN